MIRNMTRLGVAALALAACSSGTDDATSASDSVGPAADAPTIAVTTTILGDVVRAVVGDLAVVEVIMPNGASPHDFQPSAQQIALLRSADAVVANGAGFEEGLHDSLEAAEADGVPVFEAASAVETLAYAEGAEHAEEETDAGTDAEHAEEEGHAHEEGGEDPHFFTDPSRMAQAVDGLVAFLAAEVPSLATPALTAQGEQYRGALDTLDQAVADQMAAVPEDRRKLVTNHEVFSYFADRYGFEVIGVVIPGGSTQGEPDAQALAELAEAIRTTGVPAVFADTSSPQDLATALADEVGGVDVVELYSESLGEADSGADTYIGMVQTNASRIAAALAA